MTRVLEGSLRAAGTVQNLFSPKASWAVEYKHCRTTGHGSTPRIVWIKVRTSGKPKADRHTTRAPWTTGRAGPVRRETSAYSRTGTSSRHDCYSQLLLSTQYSD